MLHIYSQYENLSQFVNFAFSGCVTAYQYEGVKSLTYCKISSLTYWI